MIKNRIIARMDIKNENVIKGIRFEGLRVMGTAEELAKKYYDQGADELLYIDSVASLYGRNNIESLVSLSSKKIFIPMTVGGGIRSVEDARRMFRSGADKIAINTGAVRDRNLISNIARIYGSQSVVGSLQVKKTAENFWEIYIDAGREKTGIEAIGWAKTLAEMGVGEILVTSVDRDGTGNGVDTEFLKILKDEISLPIIASGGVKDLDDVAKVFMNLNISAVAVATCLHYNRTTVKDIKDHLISIGIGASSH